MKGDSRFYQLLADAAVVGPHGSPIRRDPALYAELKGRLMNIINGTPEDILLDYARYLRSQVPEVDPSTSDYGDLRMYAATRRVYREFLHCTGIEEEQV